MINQIQLQFNFFKLKFSYEADQKPNSFNERRHMFAL